MPRQEATPQLALKLDRTSLDVPRVTVARSPFARSRPGERFGRYQLLHTVAEGGMATVWLAQLRGEYGFAHDVAIKMILPSFASDPNFRDMFLDEACIASLVQHPNVAQILDLGEHDGKLYMVMEWVDGDSLSNLLHAAEAQGRPMPLPVLLRILADSCAGLHAAHVLRDARGNKLEVVHRDVSPQNILVSDSGCVKVIDFGVLKARGRLVDDTLGGIVKGKLHYVAPERALGATADCRADVWAVGAILYRILGGRPVYDGQGNLAIVRQLICQNDVRPLPKSVPRALREIAYKALAREPSDRYESMADLQRELETVLHGFPSATTNHDVAAFVTSVLGPSLEERRSAINLARDGQDQTGSLRCFPNATQAPVSLVAKVGAREAGLEDRATSERRQSQVACAKPALKLVREAEPRMFLPVPARLPAPALHTRAKPRSASPSRPRALAVCALVTVTALLGATIGWNLRGKSADTLALRANNVPATSPRLSGPPTEPQLVLAAPPARALGVVNVTDLPMERVTEDGRSSQPAAASGAPRPSAHSSRALAASGARLNRVGARP